MQNCWFHASVVKNRVFKMSTGLLPFNCEGSLLKKKQKLPVKLFMTHYYNSPLFPFRDPTVQHFEKLTTEKPPQRIYTIAIVYGAN